MLCNTTDGIVDFKTQSNEIEGLGSYASIIGKIQCTVDDCFYPDFIEVKLKCKDDCFDHCTLVATENLAIYLVLLFMIILLLSAVVYYFERLLHKIR